MCASVGGVLFLSAYLLVESFRSKATYLAFCSGHPDVGRYYVRHLGRNVVLGLRCHDEGSLVDAFASFPSATELLHRYDGHRWCFRFCRHSFACAAWSLSGGAAVAQTSLLLHGRFVATKLEFRIIALSNVADACAGLASSSPREARTCLERTYELALATRPKGWTFCTRIAITGCGYRIWRWCWGQRIGRGSVSMRDCMSGSLWSWRGGAFQSLLRMCRPIPVCVRAGRRIRVRRWRRCAATMSRMGARFPQSPPGATSPSWNVQ